MLRQFTKQLSFSRIFTPTTKVLPIRHLSGESLNNPNKDPKKDIEDLRNELLNHIDKKYLIIDERINDLIKQRDCEKVSDELLQIIKPVSNR